VSDGEKAKQGRRRNRRRDRRASTSVPNHADAAAGGDDPSAATGNGQPRSAQRRGGRLRTVHETSAGGLVVDGIDGPREDQVAALIGRFDRRGRMLWSLPKGHIEVGETAEQTAIREVAEETGVRGNVLAALGSIDYWFVTDGRRVHKTVHHYLMRFSGGELSDDDVEVAEVAWVPIGELRARLAYADERRLAWVADTLIDTLQTDGAAALPPLPASAPRRRPQTHSRTRNRRPDDHAPDRKNGRGPVQ
jgi:8-oxo-dGTP pyrophosphatase MutT (NUDIX family)